MIVLGIDSSTDSLSIGLASDQRIIAETNLDSRREHASHIIGMIEQTLGQGHKTLDDVSGIAIAVGPGSFTGLRVGMSVAKGMAVARNLPLAGVSTFEVITERVRRQYDDFFLAAPVRKGELYVYHVTAESRFPEDIKLIGQKRLSEYVGKLPVGMIGRAPEGWAEHVTAIIDSSRTVISGAELARIGAGRLIQGRRDDPTALEPLYIAPSQAEENFARRQRNDS